MSHLQIAMEILLFCGVKIKRILSLSLIILVLLSLAIGFSQNDFESTVIHEGDITQIVEDSDDAPLEFRKSFKLSIADKTPSESSLYSSHLVFQAVRDTQYTCYLQKHLFAKPSSRMFIDLGALII